MGNKKWEWRFHYYEWWILFLRCASCKENKPYIDFYNSKTKPLGYSWECKECQKYRNEIYYNNPENKKRKSETDKLYRQINWDKIKRRREKYQEENRERYLKSNRDAYQKRKEKAAADSKKWKDKINNENNTSVVAIHNRSRRYVKQYNLRPEICSICWRWGVDIEIHHPSYDSINRRKEVVFVCKRCHRNIHNQTVICPELIDLIQLNAHMPTILTDKDLDLLVNPTNYGQVKKEENVSGGETWENDA